MAHSARLTWVRMYEQTGDAGLTCRRCRISRPTLRKWWRPYLAEGVEAWWIVAAGRTAHPRLECLPLKSNTSFRRARAVGWASSACGTSSGTYTTSDFRATPFTKSCVAMT